MLLSGCTVVPPVEPAPTPVEVSCADACEHLATLSSDACGLGGECESLCEATRHAEAELELAMPTGCFAASASCDEASLCR